MHNESFSWNPLFSLSLQLMIFTNQI